MNFLLSRNAFGKLVFSLPDGRVVHEGVVPVRAFPVAAPDHGIALVDPDGHELVWLDSLADAPAPARELIEEELRHREFLPQIRRLASVSTFAMPSTWEIETDRGATQLILKGEEDIRRIGNGALLIADVHGMQYLIRDLAGLDRHSRKLLDRFL